MICFRQVGTESPQSPHLQQTAEAFRLRLQSVAPEFPVLRVLASLRIVASTTRPILRSLCIWLATCPRAVLSLRVARSRLACRAIRVLRLAPSRRIRPHKWVRPTVSFIRAVILRRALTLYPL